jgi:AsmA protein
MRGLRIAGIVVAALAALPVLVLVLAWLVFDPNEHKDSVQAAFREATGRELRLEGPLSVSIFPWLAVQSGRAVVANREGFGEEPFASFERARIGVRLWPLLTARRLEVGPVRVDGLELSLLVARDGRNNWSDVLDRLEQRKPADADPAAARQESGARIASIELRDASVTFVDAQAGTRYAVTQWQLETGSLERGSAVDVESSMRVARGDRDLGHVALRTGLDLTQPERVVLEQTTGELRFPSERRPDGIATALRVPRIELENASRNISVQDLEARLGEAVFTSTLHIVQGDAGPRVDGGLHLAPADLRKLFEHLGLEAPRTRDPQALRQVAVDSKVAYVPDRGLHLDARALRVDDLELEGRVDVRPGDRLAVRFDLRGTTLDADRYLPPEGTPESKPAAPARKEAPEQGSPDIAGTVALDRLVVMKVPLQDVRMDLRLRDGRLELEPLRARAFDGVVVTRLRYDYAAVEPSLSLQQQLSGVDVAALLGQMFQVKQLQGRGTARFSLESRGAGGAELFANLRGPFEVQVSDGAVLGVDLWHEIERAVAAAQLKAAAATTRGTGRTAFERLSARGTLAGRKLRNDSIEFVADFARVRGHGDLDYGRDALDLDLTARLLKAPDGRLFGVEVGRVTDAEIPLRVTGKLTEPKVRPDVSKLLEAKAKDAIKKPVEEKIKKELEKIFKF